MSTFACLTTDRRGMVSVELALVANLVLVPLTLGAMDAGQLVAARAQLDQVLHQALFHAYANPATATAATVQAAALQAAGTGAVPAVTAIITPYCITPAIGLPLTGVPSSPVSGACALSTQSLQSYLSVTATVSVTLMFTVPWAAKTSTLSVSGKARIS